jgi:hypothetical protein
MSTQFDKTVKSMNRGPVQPLPPPTVPGDDKPPCPPTRTAVASPGRRRFRLGPTDARSQPHRRTATSWHPSSVILPSQMILLKLIPHRKQTPRDSSPRSECLGDAVETLPDGLASRLPSHPQAADLALHHITGSNVKYYKYRQTAILSTNLGEKLKQP